MKNYCIREILHNMVINDFYFPCYFDNSSYIFDGKELKKKSSIGDSKLDVYIKDLKLFWKTLEELSNTKMSLMLDTFASIGSFRTTIDVNKNNVSFNSYSDSVVYNSKDDFITYSRSIKSPSTFSELLDYEVPSYVLSSRCKDMVSEKFSYEAAFDTNFTLEGYPLSFLNKSVNTFNIKEANGNQVKLIKVKK